MFLKKCCFLFILFSNIIGSFASVEESNLREKLFSNYNKNIRPVINVNTPVRVNVGVAVQNIESFDQIRETIELNVWLRKYWKNDLLSWNTSNSNITQLTLSKNQIWTPDIELLNAATLPDIYTLNGGMYLYPDGNMLWSMPAVYKFSCSLKLQDFPFDTQTCTMKFSSWSFDNRFLFLQPYEDISLQIDVLDSFSHSEWDLDDYSVKTFNESRVCSPDNEFSVNTYSFKLKRYTHYYKLNMGMTISLVIVSFIIMMVKPDNLSRTGTAVFIPLTILALQLTIANKIPVVGYYTLMDIFFLTCFITSMIVSIESGIIYTLITSKSNVLYTLFERILDFDTIVRKYNENIQKLKHRRHLHNNCMTKYIQTEKSSDNGNSGDNSGDNGNGSDNSGDNGNDNSIKKDTIIFDHKNTDKDKNTDNDSLVEFSKIESLIRNNGIKETDLDELSDSNSIDTEQNITHIIEPILKNRQKSYINVMNDKSGILDNKSGILDNKSGILDNKSGILDNKPYETIIEKDVVKIIEYDNKNLNISFKEYLIFNEITNYAILIDNICRIILPLVFLIIIIVIFSNE